MTVWLCTVTHQFNLVEQPASGCPGSARMHAGSMPFEWHLLACPRYFLLVARMAPTDAPCCGAILTTVLVLCLIHNNKHKWFVYLRVCLPDPGTKQTDRVTVISSHPSLARSLHIPPTSYNHLPLHPPIRPPPLHFGSISSSCQIAYLSVLPPIHLSLPTGPGPLL